MKNLDKTLILLVASFVAIALFFFFSIKIIGAQEDTKTFVIATVNVQNAEILSQEENNFKLAFDITNRVGVQPGIKYMVRLFSSKGGLFDEKIYDETIDLKEGDSIHKEIDYVAPDSLNGEFKVFIISENSVGLSLGGALAGDVTLNGDGGSEISPTNYDSDDYSAKVQNLILDKDFYSKGDTAKLSVTWFAREDFEKVNLQVSVEDCSNVFSKEILKEDFVPIIDVEIPIIKDCRDPQVKITLFGPDNSSLDQTDFGVVTESTPDSSGQGYVYAIIFIVLIVIIGLIIKNKKDE
ncbi:hypothetical protein ACFLZC_01105 [Patescibacteria group bacterium]